MCIGIPMQVVEIDGDAAWCEGLGTRRRVNIQLVGEQPIGTWLLTFLGRAREVLNPEDAGKISDAIKAISMVMEGSEIKPQEIDALFPDLANREPQLPAFVQPGQVKEHS